VDVVLAGVFVDEGVDRVSVGVRVVDLRERFPLSGRASSGKIASTGHSGSQAPIGVDDEDALVLVDAVDRADVDARVV
jgi:hypothetical protein